MLAPPKPPPHDELELLVKEARARQRRRRLAIATTIAVAAGTGVSAYAVASGGASREAGVNRQGRALPTRPCDARAGWRLRLGPGWSEPTGQHTAAIALVRNAANRCRLHGFPTIALLDPSKGTLHFRYSHAGDRVVAGRPPRTVRVGGGHSAFFIFNKYRCDVRATSAARWLRVRVPGIRGWLTLRLPHYPIIDFCPVAGPSTAIAVSPIVARPAQAAAKPQ